MGVVLSWETNALFSTASFNRRDLNSSVCTILERVVGVQKRPPLQCFISLFFLAQWLAKITDSNKSEPKCLHLLGITRARELDIG